MRSDDVAFYLGLLAVISLIVVSVSGWTLNLIYLVTTEPTLSVLTALQIIGIFFAPLGVVLGWILFFVGV